MKFIVLNHWGRVAHICADKLNIISSDNGLLPGRHQAVIWTNAGILLIAPLRTNFNEILIGIQTFQFKKMHLKMSSANWRPFCLGLNVLNTQTHTKIRTHKNIHTYTPGKKFLQKIFKLIFHSVRHWVASWKIVNIMCIYLVTCLAKMSRIDHIVLEQFSWNQHNFGQSKSQLFVTGQYDFVMGKITISQRWQVIGMKAAGTIVSHIAQTMQMSQRTVYSIQKRHRENPGDVKDRPRSRRRRATTTVGLGLHVLYSVTNCTGNILGSFTNITSNRTRLRCSRYKQYTH